MEQEEGFFQHLSDEVLLMIVKFAYDAHDVVLADAEHRSPPPAADRALVEVMSALGLVSRRWRRVACDPTLWRQRHDTVFGGAPFPHLRPPFPHIAWRQAYLAKAKRWWSVRNSRIPPQGGCHPPILFAVVEGAPALLDRLLMTEKPDTVAEALSCLSAQNLVQANSLEVALKVLQAREARGGERDYEEWYLTTPIYEAACWGNVELVKLMLDRRRHPSGLLTLGTAMQLAAREGREQVVRYFVDNELALAHDPVANVQEQSVVLAASRGHAKTVEALLEGYPPDLFDIDDDKDDKTGRGARETLRMALISAVSGGHVETVRVLVEEVDYNWQLVKTIDLGAIDALLPDPADEPAGSQQGAVRKKWSGRLLSSRWMRTAAETSPALAIELGWLLMAKGFDIDSGCPLNALQIAAQAQESESLVNCLLSMGANPKARGSPGSASPEVLAGLKGNTTIVDALSAAAASRGVTPATATPLIALKTTTEHEEIVPDAGKKRKAPNPPDDADDEEAGGGDDGATSVKRRRTEGNEVRRMAELIREWVAERWSEVTAHDWIPRHFTTFYLRAQLRQCGLQPQGDERVELMRQLAEHIAKSRRKRHAILQDEDPVVYTRVELPDPFQLFIIPSAGALAPHLFAPLVL